MISLKVREENVRIKKIFKKAWENGGKNVGQNLKKKDGEIGKRKDGELGKRKDGGNEKMKNMDYRKKIEEKE